MGNISASHLIRAVLGKAILLPERVWTTSLSSPCGCFPLLFQDKAAHFSWEREPLIKGEREHYLVPHTGSLSLNALPVLPGTPPPHCMGKESIA